MFIILKISLKYKIFILIILMESELSYDNIKELIVNNIDNFLQLNEIDAQKELLINLFNKYFINHYSALLLEIDNIANLIKSKNKYSLIDLVDYIQFITTIELYNYFMGIIRVKDKTLLTTNDKSLFYGIIWTEHIKYDLYTKVINGLNNQEGNIDHINKIIELCQNKKNNCINYIKITLSILKNEFPELSDELQMCNQLIQINQIYKE